MKCAFEHGNKCIALTGKCCEGCRFRKTKRQIEEGRRKAKRRINSLPQEMQIYIKTKYIFRSEKWEEE